MNAACTACVPQLGFFTSPHFKRSGVSVERRALLFRATGPEIMAALPRRRYGLGSMPRELKLKTP
jgi:hypothetical protein